MSINYAIFCEECRKYVGLGVMRAGGFCLRGEEIPAIMDRCGTHCEQLRVYPIDCMPDDVEPLVDPEDEEEDDG